MITDLSEEKIIQSWNKNSAPWVQSVRENRIESRVLVTNQAIVEAVVSVAREQVLDLGCGEGWLSRELIKRKLSVMGVDAVPELIEKARLSGSSRFEVMSYEDIANKKLELTFDTLVCNFSLLGKKSVEDLFQAVPELLNPGGYFIVQTIHPVFGGGTEDYTDGWRKGSWKGFAEGFTDPAPWYFRTLSSWFELFRQSGLEVIEIQEPVNPVTKMAASVIFISRVGAEFTGYEIDQ
ncbi:methyltransferase type 12 [Motiliproteus sp. MSK22-1]|nr:methyltransferase type 12 [Motiliproteus sp. MSK22-1]